MHYKQTNKRRHPLQMAEPSSQVQLLCIIRVSYSSHLWSSTGLHDSKATSNQLRDLLILVLKQTESVSNIVPLPLSLTSRQSSSKLVCELLGVFVLSNGLAIDDGHRVTTTYFLDKSSQELDNSLQRILFQIFLRTQ